LAFEKLKWEAEQKRLAEERAMEHKKWEAEQKRLDEEKKEELRRWEVEQKWLMEEKDAEHKRIAEKVEADRELERKRIDFEQQKAEQEHQRWIAERDDRKRREAEEQQRRDEDQRRQDEKERRQAERKDDNAAKARKYGEAIRGSIIPMGADPIEAVVFFRRVEQLFTDYAIPAGFQAKVISPFLSTKAKAVLSPEVIARYQDMKAAILQELKLSANTYLEKLNTTSKAGDETFVAYASKLRGILNYYLESRNVSDFDTICQLLVCDRIKSTLSEACLKYILSIESSRDDGWLSIKELTESIERFVAAKGDTYKPHAYAIGQTQQRKEPPKPFTETAKNKGQPSVQKKQGLRARRRQAWWLHQVSRSFVMNADRQVIFELNVRN